MQRKKRFNLKSNLQFKTFLSVILTTNNSDDSNTIFAYLLQKNIIILTQN